MLRTRPVVMFGVLAAVALSACQLQQLEIDFTIRNTGTLSLNSQGQKVMTLTGVLACSKGSPGIADKEPLDMFTSITQGSLVFGLELNDKCSPPKVWSKTFAVDDRFAAGEVTVRITTCTNPSEMIDEDCTTDTEVVTLTVA